MYRNRFPNAAMILTMGCLVPLSARAGESPCLVSTGARPGSSPSPSRGRFLATSWSSPNAQNILRTTTWNLLLAR